MALVCKKVLLSNQRLSEWLWLVRGLMFWFVVLFFCQAPITLLTLLAVHSGPLCLFKFHMCDVMSLTDAHLIKQDSYTDGTYR